MFYLRCISEIPYNSQPQIQRLVLLVALSGCWIFVIFQHFPITHSNTYLLLFIYLNLISKFSFFMYTFFKLDNFSFYFFHKFYLSSISYFFQCTFFLQILLSSRRAHCLRLLRFGVSTCPHRQVKVPTASCRPASPSCRCCLPAPRCPALGYPLNKVTTNSREKCQIFMAKMSTNNFLAKWQ